MTNSRTSMLDASLRSFQSQRRRSLGSISMPNWSIFQPKESMTPQSSLKNMGVSSLREAYFVFAVGLLLSLNSGYINGLCLSGLLTEEGSHKQSVSAFTGTYTKSGLALANGEVQLFGFEFTLILAFICGAMIAGLFNPKAIPHKLVPAYGPTFLCGSLCMVAAAISSMLHPEGMALFYFAAMANGIQNGMTSMYSANLIRTTHLTGTSTDIGLIIGQMLRGNWKNYWKFKVLVGLATFFWLGGFISFYSASWCMSWSLWFSAALFLMIGVTHVIFVVLTEKVSFTQACFGKWGWDRVLEHVATSMGDGEGPTALADLTPEQIDHVFDQIDGDGSGEIDGDELKAALEKMGMKLTKKNVKTMIAVVDENDDGVVDRQEFHTLVGMATLRAVHREEVKERKRESAARMRRTISTVGRSGTRMNSVTMSSKDGNSEDSLPEIAKDIPRTYQEALPKGGCDSRAIIVTESNPPFKVVGVNEPWERLCGYKSEEALGKSMSTLIQGAKTNRAGLKTAMEKLNKGADHVQCTTVNYRKDGSQFNNFLTMGPLYGDNFNDNGEKETAYFFGILKNIGELAQDMANMNEEKKDEADSVDDMV